MHYLFFLHITCTECGPGKHGVNCMKVSSPYCADPDTCGHQDGVCDCIEWVVGNTCNSVICTYDSFTKISLCILLFIVLNIIVAPSLRKMGSYSRQFGAVYAREWPVFRLIVSH